MAGPYEDPMQGQMAPPNPQGGGMPGQPRNPATGGYPSRDVAPSPLQPGQIQNPDLYGRSMQNRQWQRMMRGRMFPGMGGGMIGSPGMWGGERPRFDPTMGGPVTQDMSKQGALDNYKRNLQAQKNGAEFYAPIRPPSWMSEDRASEIAGRIGARPPTPPGTMPPDNGGPLPPWFGGPTGGLFGPPQWAGGGGYQPYGGQMPGGGATPPGGAKPGGPAPQYGTPAGPAGDPLYQANQRAQPGAQAEPAVYPA